MCGIMGYMCFSKKKPDKSKITEMFKLLETRGRDASGFAFLNRGNLIVHKAPMKSTDLVKTKEWLTLELPEMMIMHTRLKTQGSEKNNANNHPIFSKSGIALVHNGMIHNDKEIIGKKDRDAEVDSEALLALWSMKIKGDKIKRLFERIEGSFAVAIIDKAEPDKLVLIKKDNPIDMYYDSADDILYFCSERYIMQQALGITKSMQRGFTIGEGYWHFYEMENNHALVINKDGVESYHRYTPRRSSWYDRDLFLPKRVYTGEITVECPWCLNDTSYIEGKLNNVCSTCGQNISEEDFYFV